MRNLQLSFYDNGWIVMGGTIERMSVSSWKLWISFSLQPWDHPVTLIFNYIGGGRNVITPRFLRHFNMLSFVELETASMEKIFFTIMSFFLNKFSSEVQGKIQALVDSSIHIYHTIRSELLPTPNKSHYTFNLRDLAKVIQGVLSADIKTVTQDSDIVRLWTHECMRVFQDRLVDKEDRGWFRNLLMSTMSQKLDCNWTEVVTVEPIIYGDYLVPGADPKIYTEIKVKSILLIIGYAAFGKIGR
jgi:dynein heavy chain